MRCPIYFNTVSKIVPITSTIQGGGLPKNIEVSEGRTRAEKRLRAVDILLKKPEVNAVILINEKRPEVEQALQAFHHICEVIGRRLKTRVSKGCPDSVQENVNAYFSKRASEQHKQAELFANAQRHVSNFLEKAVRDATISVPGPITRSSEFTFVRDYKHPQSQGAYINGHTDRADEYDLREIECCEGSGTILFADDDFEFEGAPNDFETKIVQVSNRLQCWSLMSGSSAIMRVPSSKWAAIGARPVIHAHGIGRIDGQPEARLTIRHDHVVCDI